MAITLIGGLILVGLGAWIAIGWLSVAGVAEPPYDVLSEQNGYEIRQYAPQLVAEVEVTGNFTEATNRGFRALADYIFGNNTASGGDAPDASESIAMTAPVIEREATSEAIAMTAPVIEATESEGRHV
ncbi:MAG: heme-binding protein, partial [Gammaproteobacteria bacterium]|nr:heme-binding protein [Gammaproteobacteria bacterium]